MLRLILKKTLIFSLLACLILVFFIFANLNTYYRLTNEKPIAQLEFTPIQPQEFDVNILLADDCEKKVFRLYGDEWRVDVQFLKWKSWATLIGIDAMYRIERLSGRYKNIQDENSKQHIAHNLAPTSTLNLSKIAEQYNNVFPPVDTVYGSSAYEEMNAEKVFTVFRSQTGIFVRQEPIAEHALDSSCSTHPTHWKNIMLDIDAKFASFIRSF